MLLYVVMLCEWPSFSMIKEVGLGLFSNSNEIPDLGLCGIR